MHIMCMAIRWRLNLKTTMLFEFNVPMILIMIQYIVMHHDELFVRQVRINDGIFTMHSLNDKYVDINIQLDDAEPYPVIIGKVVDSITPLQVN